MTDRSRQPIVWTEHACNLAVYGIFSPHTCPVCGQQWIVRDHEWKRVWITKTGRCLFDEDIWELAAEAEALA